MGYAYGTLLKDEINELVPSFFDYIRSNIEASFGGLLPEVAKIVEDFGVPAALDFTWHQTLPYIPQAFYLAHPFYGSYIYINSIVLCYSVLLG